MERRSCAHLHSIRAIKGGSVMKVLNVCRGKPALLFKKVAEIYDILNSNNDHVKGEGSCIDAMKERPVKDVADASVCNVNDGDNRTNNLDDDGFDNFTLKQIKKSCKSRKRKRSQGPDSSTSKVKIEVLTPAEDDSVKEQMAADDLDFMETLSGWRSKLSKRKKSKKPKCVNDPMSANTFKVIPSVKSEEIQNDQDQEFPPSSGNSAALALVEVKCEVQETDFRYGSYDYSGIVAKEDAAEVAHKWNEFNDEGKKHDFIPLRIEWPSNSCMDIVISNTELISDQSPNFPAIESQNEECVSHPYLHCNAPEAISLLEYHNSETCYNQPEDDVDTPIILPIVATNKSLDSPVIGSCSEDDYPVVADVQEKPSSAIEHSLSPGGCMQCDEKQSFASVDDDEKRDVNEVTDELPSWDEQKDSSKLHRPRRLLSTRKTISPTAQERLRAMESFDSNHNKNSLKCRGKLCLDDQIDKNGAADGPRPGFTPKRALKISHSSRPANRRGCNSAQSCSKSAITFSKQQMQDAECLTMKLTKELKSMKDIVDDMLRSGFYLNASLRYKVNKARMAVKNATKAEDAAKRCLALMARDCNRFCKIMTLADGGPYAPQGVVRKEGKKVVFADEAGGSLCQVKFYEDDVVSLLESDRKGMQL